jgi:hypothetical protein
VTVATSLEPALTVSSAQDLKSFLPLEMAFAFFCFSSSDSLQLSSGVGIELFKGNKTHFFPISGFLISVFLQKDFLLIEKCS